MLSQRKKNSSSRVIVSDCSLVSFKDFLGSPEVKDWSQIAQQATLTGSALKNLKNEAQALDLQYMKCTERRECTFCSGLKQNAEEFRCIAVHYQSIARKIDKAGGETHIPSHVIHTNVVLRRYERRISTVRTSYCDGTNVVWHRYESRMAPVRKSYGTGTKVVWHRYERRIATVRTSYGTGTNVVLRRYERRMAPVRTSYDNGTNVV